MAVELGEDGGGAEVEQRKDEDSHVDRNGLERPPALE